MHFLLGLLALFALADSAQAAAPVILQDPASQTTTVGQPVTFMSNAGGTPPLFFQWQRGTLNIPNATNRNYFIPGAQLSDNGAQFRVIVTNASGSATSTVATLTVGPDNTPPTVSKVGNTADFMQIKVKFSERVGGSAANDPANYQLDAPGINITSAVLALDGTNVTLTVAPALTEGNGYTLSVANILDLANNPLSPDPTLIPFQAAVPPMIETSPTDRAVNPGQPATFTVAAFGTSPLSYQWYKGPAPIPGETSTQLQFASVTQSNLGTYYVVVTNSAGSVTSAVARLSFLESYELDLPAGYSLIANHYYTPVPTFPTVPPLTQLSIWRVPVGGFELYTFDPDLGGWQPSTPSLSPGEGAIIYLPSPTALVFTGQRVPPNVPPGFPPGFHLVSSSTPKVAGYNDIVAAAPKEGQIVYQLRPGGDPSHFDENNYRLSFFRSGMWHDGPPKVNVGESVWIGFADPVGITVQPVGQTNVPGGQSVTLSVTVTGAPPVHFQWLLNGSPIPGATNSSYGIPAMNPTNGGIYTVSAGNVVGDVVSEPAPLTANVTGINLTDDFDSQISVNNFTFVRSSHNRGATRANGEPAHAGKRANASVWITWTAGGTPGIMTINTAGSSFDTILAAYTGNTISALTQVDASDDDAGYACSRIAFNVVPGTAYRICVAGLGDETGDIVLSWVFQATAQVLPEIVSQPQDLSIGDGGFAQFTVLATNGNFAYQWFRNGVPLSQGTNATLTISNASFDDVGYYFVRIINGTRIRDSELVSLQLEKTEPGQPLTGARGAPKFFDLNLQDGGSGQPLKGGGKPNNLIVGTVNHGYSGGGSLPCALGRDPGEPYPCSIYGANTSWYGVQADTNGTIYIGTDGSNFDTLVAAYIGPGNSYSTLTNVACDNNSGLDGFDSRINFPAEAGKIYFVQVQGVGAASGTAALGYRLVRPLSITNLFYTNGFGGRFTMKVNSTSNLLTRVQYSTNFNSTNWITLTNYTPVSGTFNLTNSNVGSSTNRYYRALNIF
jgi:hypothetical protein